MKDEIEEAIQTAELVMAAIEWEYPLEYCIAIETLIEAVRNGRQSEKMDR